MADREAVALLVDFENIRISLQKHFSMLVKTRDIAKTLRAAAGDYGRALICNAYLRSDQGGSSMGADFQAEGYEPVFVVPKQTGQDRTDMKLSMDGQRLLYTRAGDLSAFLIASGDGDFTELARTITQANKRLIVISVGQTASRELIALANPFIPIESLLHLGQPSGPLPEPSGGASAYNWEPFIQQLAKAETYFSKGFVGFSHFADRWLNTQMGPIATIEDRRTLINEAVSLGIAESYQVANTSPNSQRPMSWALRVNRNHPLVQKVLSLVS